MMSFKVTELYGLHARSVVKLLRFLDEKGIKGNLIFRKERVGLDSIIDIMRLSISKGDIFSIHVTSGNSELLKTEHCDVLLKAIGIERIDEGRMS